MLTIALALTLLASSSSAAANKLQGRIAGGVDAKAHEGFDYAILSVVFVNQWQRCGGSLLSADFVLTSATCVFDPVEGVANIVNITFPRSTSSSSNLMIYIHPDYNESTHEHDLAIIRMNTSVSNESKFVSYAVLDTDNSTDAYVYSILRGCGTGSTSNYPKYSSKLLCTDLVAVADSDCSDLANIVCTQWSDRENNLCSGDFGGPIYSMTYNASLPNPSKSTPIMKVVGIASYSPDVRGSAPCLGGQQISHVQVGAYIDWIDSILSKGFSKF